MLSKTFVDTPARLVYVDPLARKWEFICYTTQSTHFTYCFAWFFPRVYSSPSSLFTVAHTAVNLFGVKKTILDIHPWLQS